MIMTLLLASIKKCYSYTVSQYGCPHFHEKMSISYENGTLAWGPDWGVYKKGIRESPESLVSHENLHNRGLCMAQN